MSDKFDRSAAGIPAEKPVYDMAGEPGFWDDMDMLFFETNPKRTHHVRAPYSGELDAMARAGERPLEEAPEDSFTNVVIRRVGPKTIVKAVMFMGRQVPDDEDTAQTMFDESCSDNPPGKFFIRPSHHDDGT